jgi:hypothetical protein
MQRVGKTVILQQGITVVIAEDAVVARREESLAGKQVGVGDTRVDRVERQAQLFAAAVEVGIRVFLRTRRQIRALPLRQVAR